MHFAIKLAPLALKKNKKKSQGMGVPFVGEKQKKNKKRRFLYV